VALPQLNAYLVEGDRSFAIYARNSDAVETKKAASGFFSALAKLPVDGRAAFTLKAAVSLKTEKRAAVCETLPLAVSSSSGACAGPASVADAGGWRVMGQNYGWLPAAGPRHFDLSFSSSALDSQALTGFDELWIDYQNLIPGSPVNLSAQISGEIPDYYGGVPQRVAAFSGQSVLSPAVTFEPAKSVWLPKKYSYSLGRVLRRKPDEHWRYTGLGDATVIQRRMHMEITGFEYLDFIFAPGTEPVGVNVRLAAKDNYSPGVMTELGALPAGYTSEGTLWRLALPALLKDRFAGKDTAFLQEIIVFVKGSPEVVASVRPLERVVFQKLGRQEEELFPAAGQPARGAEITSGRSKVRFEPLPAHLTALDGSITRMVVDLRPLTRLGEVFFKDGKIILTPDAPAALSAGSIKDVRLVSLCEVKAPLYYGYGESFLSRWGEEVSNPLPSETGEVWPVMRGYFPFAVLSAKLPAAKPLPDLSLLPYEKQVRAFLASQVKTAEPEEAATLPFVLRDKYESEEQRLRAEASAHPEDRGRMAILDHGVGFSAGKPFVSVESSPDGFVLAGEGRHLRLSLSLPSEIKADTRLFLSLPEGADKILSTELTAVFEDGEFSLRINHNRPEVLGRAGRLKSLRFNFLLSGGAYRLKFKELALFEPVLMEGVRAFELKLPGEFPDFPVAGSVSAPAGALLSASKGMLQGSLPPGYSGSAALSWRAAAGQPVEWFKGVGFSYRVPARTAAANPCWLKLTLEGEKSAITAALCPKGAQGRIFVTPSELSAGNKDIGKFIGASYKAELGELSFSPDKSFEFGMVYEGYKMVSVADSFADWPVASAFGRSLDFYRDANSFKELPEKTVELIGKPDASSRLAASGRLEPAEHPWFQLDSAVVEPLPAVSSEAWDRLITPPVPAAGPGLPVKLLKLAVYALLAFLAWKGFRKIPWNWFAVKTGSLSGLLWGGVKTGTGTAWEYAKNYFALANKIILFAALGPGLWYAAGLAGPASGARVMFFIILGAGAYWHNLRNTGRASSGWWFADGSGLPPFLKILGVLAALYAVWTAGRGRLVSEVRWNLLPLSAVIYFFLPWLATDGAQKGARLLRCLSSNKARTLAAFWSAAAGGLYGAGLRSPVSGGENYYFTFGALALAFAGRYLAAVLAPVIRRFGPGLAEELETDPAKPYFAAAILGLVFTAGFVSTGMQPVAEQAAIVVYYCLVIGVFKEGVGLYRTRNDAQAGEPENL
jgi:hypothetical protein